MNSTRMALAGTALAVLVIGCASPSNPTATRPTSLHPMERKFADGEMPVPADYKAWPKILGEVQRADAKQVREVYLNPVGHAVKTGEPFPNGTVSVMELYKARENADGTLMKGVDGKLVKGELLKVFVMAKGAGWGESVKPAELRNGDWVYSAFLADGKTTAPDPMSACRSCHLPMAGKDYFARYDEYIKGRASY